tara:strand:- start:2121 stop:2861 length:741 start_codon:yes stop_codon:yes gene_type:complete
MKDFSIHALLLAAGYGKRLRPITNDIPKCLVKIGGSSLLELWIAKLIQSNVRSVLINTHYLSEKVNLFLNPRLLNKYKEIKIQISHEENLLGTAKTMINNKEFFRNKIGLLIHADNFYEGDLSNFLKAHFNRPKKCLLTMLTFKTDNPKSCGVVEIDSEGIVNKFYEKVENPPTNLANAAIYAFDNNFIDWIEEYTGSANDFSNDILPKLLGRIYTYKTSEFFADIGTPKMLEKANDFVNRKNINK